MIEKFGFAIPMHNDKVFGSVKSVRHEYTLPPGHIIKLQGYEPLGLDLLLKEYDEQDMLYTIADICEHIGIIRYEYDGRPRRYYPDFFIFSAKRIVEVKSAWTFDMHKETNMLKRDACLRIGYDYEFIIFDGKRLKDRLVYSHAEAII